MHPVIAICHCKTPQLTKLACAYVILVMHKVSIDSFRRLSAYLCFTNHVMPESFLQAVMAREAVISHTELDVEIGCCNCDSDLTREASLLLTR